MNKKIGIFKRLIALLLIFLLSINSFAAVVSDNDGSAFITKAEFDSLKNNFQSQIDQYNQSIDSKIDGAIASYLAGIQLKEYIDPINYHENLKTLIGMDMRHRATLEDTDSGDLGVGVRLDGTLQLYLHYWDGFQYGCRFMWNDGGVNGRTNSTVFLATGDLHSPSYMVANTSYVLAYGKGNKDYPAGTTVYTDRIFFPFWTWSGDWEKYCTAKTLNDIIGYHGDTLVEKSENQEFAFNYDEAADQRNVYRCEKLLNGAYKLKYYSKVKIQNEMSAWAHTYSDTWWAKNVTCSQAKIEPYCKDNGRNLSAKVLSETQGTVTNFGSQPPVGTKYEDGAHDGLYINSSVNLYDDSTFDDISAIQYAKAPAGSSTIYCVSTTPVLTSGTTKEFTLDDVKWTLKYFLCGFGETTQTNDGPKVKINYKSLKCENLGLDFKTIENEPLTNVYGQKVSLGEGQPLLRFNTKEISYDLLMKFACLNESGASVSGSCAYIISDTKFTNGVVDASHILKQGNVSNGGTVTLTLTPNQNDELWIHLTPSASTYDCTVSEMSFTHG